MVEEVHYIIRPARDRDARQVVEIDREAFAGNCLFRSPNSYRREIHNSTACYIVAGMGEEPEETEQPRVPWYKRLFHNRNSDEPSNNDQYILGFAGLWIMPDEGHITSIGVRNDYRHAGIGERLLISLIDLAAELGLGIMTLEVRASNKTAQALYRKYGFRVIGKRRHYYSDNGEDALIMSTPSITSASFQSHFQQLKESHNQRRNSSFPAACPQEAAVLHQTKERRTDRVA